MKVPRLISQLKLDGKQDFTPILSGDRSLKQSSRMQR